MLQECKICLFMWIFLFSRRNIRAAISMTLLHASFFKPSRFSFLFLEIFKLQIAKIDHFFYSYVLNSYNFLMTAFVYPFSTESFINIYIYDIKYIRYSGVLSLLTYLIRSFFLGDTTNIAVRLL